MCCRYYMEMSPAFRPIAEAAQRSALYRNNITKIARPLLTEGEVHPDSLVPVLACGKSGKKAVFPMLWGYRIPGIPRPVANARVETVPEKKTFRAGWAMHRCAIPASWYYEWQHTRSPSGTVRSGDKYAIMPRDSAMTWLCGIYRLEDGFPHFVILTREPGEAVASIHDRMPLIVSEDAVDAWIDPNRNPYMVLNAALTDMVCERSGGVHSPWQAGKTGEKGCAGPPQCI